MEDKRKQIAYENAIDCLYYGYGWKEWDSLNLTEEEKKEIWEKAIEYLASL